MPTSRAPHQSQFTLQPSDGARALTLTWEASHFDFERENENSNQREEKNPKENQARRPTPRSPNESSQLSPSPPPVPLLPADPPPQRLPLPTPPPPPPRLPSRSAQLALLLFHPPYSAGAARRVERSGDPPARAWTGAFARR
jgi:hypothetical protein